MDFISGQVKLRKLLDSDIDIMAELANNKKIRDNVRDAFPYPYTQKDAEAFILLCRKEKPRMTFVIEYKGDFSGVIGLSRQPDVNRNTAEIGYWIGEPYWNKGIATVAVKIMVTYGFEELNFVRIHTGVFEYNDASKRVLEKCGFQLEGIFKKNVTKNGRIWDEYRYALCKVTKI